MKQRKLQSGFDMPSDSPGFLLWQVTNTWERKQRAALREVDLTHVQFVLLATLAWLTQEGQDVTQVVLSQFAKTDVMMTSQVLRTLAAKGLLTREQHPVDTRAKVLTVTEAGHGVLERAITLVEQVDRDFFAGLGAESTQIVALFRRLLSHE
ncbi:MAG: MarR family winged helix-turn-helix transcriptional regulator [Bacilli bacterium]